MHPWRCFRQSGGLQRAAQATSRRHGLVGHGFTAVHSGREWPAEGGRKRTFLNAAARNLILFAPAPHRRAAPPSPSPHPSAPRPALLRPTSTPAFCSPVAVSVRHCSHRRNMCKQFGADAPGAAMDISQAREVLPTNVKPLHYDLTLEPDFDKFTFEGSVTIEYATAACRHPHALSLLTEPACKSLMTPPPLPSTPST